MVKKSWGTFVLAAALAGLTGCAGNKNDDVVDSSRDNLHGNNVRNDTLNDFNIRNVSNRDLNVSTRASKNIERIPDVDQAHVIIRGNDAYVAVSLKNHTHTGASNRKLNGGTASFTRTDNDDRVNDTDLGARTEGNSHPGSGDNTNYKKPTSALEKRIENQVRAADRTIDHVYISYDNHFFRQMTNYSNDIRNGRNMDSLVDDFTNTINKTFRR